jgi:hypothetical protein
MVLFKRKEAIKRFLISEIIIIFDTRKIIALETRQL